MISKRAEIYGKAFFEVCADEQTLKNLKALSEAFKDKNSLEFFNSFVISTEEKKQALEMVFKKEDKFIRNLFFLLVEKRALSFLPEIIKTYENLLNNQKSREQGVVYSVKPLSSEEKEKLAQAIGKFLNKKIDLTERTDKKAISGLYVKVGDYVFNDTIQGHLNKFKKLGGL